MRNELPTLKKQVNALQNISLKPSTSIQNGSVVQTNHGLFFFGIAFGKLNSEEHDLIGLSLNSPLGKLMTEKTAGDEFTFMNRNTLFKTLTNGFEASILHCYFTHLKVTVLDALSTFRLPVFCAFTESSDTERK